MYGWARDQYPVGFFPPIAKIALTFLRESTYVSKYGFPVGVIFGTLWFCPAVFAHLSGTLFGAKIARFRRNFIEHGHFFFCAFVSIISLSEEEVNP